MAKPIKLNKAIQKRVQRAQYEQPRHGKCIICAGNFDDCPHTWNQTVEAVKGIRMAESLGIELNA